MCTNLPPFIWNWVVSIFPINPNTHQHNFVMRKSKTFGVSWYSTYHTQCCFQKPRETHGSKLNCHCCEKKGMSPTPFFGVFSAIDLHFFFFWQVTGLREAIPGKKRLKYFHQPNVLTTRTITGFFPQELTVSLLGQSWTYDLKPFLNSGCFVWIISASTSGNNQIFTDIQNISETLKLKKKKGKNWWLFLRTSWTKKCIYSPPC